MFTADMLLQVDLHLIPLLTFLYLMSYIDRTNLGPCCQFLIDIKYSRLTRNQEMSVLRESWTTLTSVETGTMSYSASSSCLIVCLVREPLIPSIPNIYSLERRGS